jgi:chromate reductase
MVESQRMGNSPRLTILVGSLRAGSFNQAAAQVAADHLSGKADVSWPDLSSVPFFNQDVEALGDPSSVLTMKEAVCASQAVLFFTPEYNSGIPAVTKNAVDWLSRPFGNGCLTDRILGVAAAGPSSSGAENARASLLQICETLSNRVYPKTLGIPGVFSLENGRLSEAGETAVRVWIDEILAFSHKWQTAPT